MSRLKLALSVFFKSAKNELGLVFVIAIMALIVSVVVIPVALLASYLPDWCWWIWGAFFLAWMLFGDSISKAWDAYKNSKGGTK